MVLPNLAQYRLNYLQKGVDLPLATVPFNSTGLLELLPPAPTDKTGWPWTEQTTPATYHPDIKWPKITVVTPSYNQDAYLEQTIRSVLLQNYPNLEFIIIDGGSTDKSKLIIEKYAPWISYRQSEKDNGQGHAINLGFSLASGRYYSWINSDDYYLNNVFYRVVRCFLSARVDFIYGYAYSFNVAKQHMELIKVPPFLDRFIRIPTLAQPSCFWSAGIHQPIWEELQCSLDYELWLRLVKGNSRKLIRKPLSVANVHDGAKTADPKMQAAWQQDHELICSNDAHGPVYTWHKMVFQHRILLKINNLLNR